MTAIGKTPRGGRLDLLRCASTGALATVLMFLLCWVTTAIGTPLAHSFISLFTVQPVASTSALWMGSLCAFIFGGVAGGLVAHCYNLAGHFLGR
jgi:hypothetical protein